jgi:hypothetical protein
MPQKKPAAEADGDSLWRLSQRFFNDPAYFAEPLLLSRLANHQTVTAQAEAFGLTIAGLAALALCRAPVPAASQANGRPTSGRWPSTSE